MKKMLLFCFAVLLTVNCTGQEKPVTIKLQQVEFQDQKLKNILADLSKNDSHCFNKNDYYVLNFFQSSLTNKEYYLTVNEFLPKKSEDLDAIGYYVAVDDFIFLISKKISQEMIKITPKIKNFRFYIMDAAFPCADYYFIIWKKRDGTYEMLLNYCTE